MDTERPRMAHSDDGGWGAKESTKSRSAGMVLGESFGGKYSPEFFERLNNEQKRQIIEEADRVLDIVPDDFFVLEAITDRVILPDDKSWDNDGLLKFAKSYAVAVDNVNDDIETKDKVGGILYHYFNARGIDDEHLKGFCQNVVPMIKNRDPRLDEVMPNDPNEPIIKEYRRRFRKYEVEYGQFGFGDWTIHAFSSLARPRNIAELLVSQRTLPATNYNRFEQNRKDAILLTNAGLLPDRDLVHDQIPGSHLLIQLMMDFYEKQDDISKENLINKLRKEASGVNAGIYGVVGFDDLSDAEILQKNLPVLTISKYNEVVDGVPVHEILRQLEQNMRVVPERMPIIEDENLRRICDEKDFDGSWNWARNVLKGVNDDLIQRSMGYSLSPNYIDFLAYTERMATLFMRQITRKDLNELFYEPGFKEIMKFRELTFSYEDYDVNDFERFWEHFSSVEMDDTDGKLERYKDLAMHITNQIGKLAKYFDTKSEKYLSDILCSGNLNREMQVLMDRYDTTR